MKKYFLLSFVFLIISCQKSGDVDSTSLVGIDMSGEYVLQGYECYDVADNKFYQGTSPYYSDKISINKNIFKNTLEYNGCTATISGRIVAQANDNQSGTAIITSQLTLTMPGNSCNIESAFQSGSGTQPSRGPEYAYTLLNHDTLPDSIKEYRIRDNVILMRTEAFGTGSDTCYFAYSNGKAPDPVPLKWNNGGQKVDTITIDASYADNSFLIGTAVETYLESDSNHTNAKYCFVSSYEVAGEEFELRTSVTPISFYDFATYRTIKNLRVNFSDVSDSMSVCNPQLRKYNDIGTYVLDTSSPSPVYDPAEICPSCTSMVTSSKLRLFKRNGIYLDEVPTSNINMSSLTMKINPDNGSSGTCSNTDCRTRGYDCCLENQCVQDGATRPNAHYSSEYEVAQQAVLQNPLSYLNYPQIFYICGGP